MNEWLDDDSALHRITVWIYMDVDNTEKECCYPWKREGRRQQCMQERVNEWDSRFQMVALAKEEDEMEEWNWWSFAYFSWSKYKMQEWDDLMG